MIKKPTNNLEKCTLVDLDTCHHQVCSATPHPPSLSVAPALPSWLNNGSRRETCPELGTYSHARTRTHV